jgi:hypothetical protein
MFESLNRIARAIALSGLLATAIFAQQFRGTVSGLLRDPQGAVITGARVAATQSETGAKSQTVTGPTGQFNLPFLAPGTYTISIETPGFKRYVRDSLVVSANEPVALDVTLEVGQASESVTVSADAPLLQTETASTGQVINSKQVEDMPLNGRTPMVLAQLAFGVIPNSDPRFYRPFDDSGPSSFAMGGGASKQNELLLDGTPDASVGGGLGFSPPVDAVTEVKVESFQADAAYGHTGGGTANVVTKSGTNAFHGTAYDFFQNSVLGANLFFTNLAGQPKLSTNYNQWGATVGGPVIVPKVFNGKNRVFFFLAYEGINLKIPQASFVTVPTVAERGGDFSALLRLGSNYQIYDPASGVKQGSRVARQPFPGNIIPASLISPIAKTVLGFIDPPNFPGNGNGTNNYYVGTPGELDTFDSELGRLDFNLSDRHKLFYNFRHNDRLLQGGRTFAGNDATGTILDQVNWGSTLDDVVTLSPSLVLNTRFNFLQNSELRLGYSNGFDYTSLGLPKSLLGYSTHTNFPQFNFDNFAGLGSSRGGGIYNPYDVFQIFTSLNKNLNRHVLKAGADLRLLRHNNLTNGQSSGVYNFSTAFTRGPLDNSSAAPLGQDFASFLLGLPTGGSWDYNTAESSQNGYLAFFVQDDFRVRSNLSLNVGLRLEHEIATTERYNRSVSGFDFNSPSPISAAARAAYSNNPLPELPAAQFVVNGGLLFPSSSRRSLFQTPAVNVGPRFGIAWSPEVLGGKTVIRAGTGVFFFPIAGVGTGVDQTGFSQQTSLVSSLDGNLTPYATLANPFPDGIQLPVGSAQGLGTYLGKSIGYTSYHLKTGYSYRWNFDVQRQFARDILVEIGYEGNHGVHLGLNRSLAVLPGQYLSKSPFRDQTTIDFLTANVTNPFAGLIPGTTLNGSSVQRQQLLQAFPQFTGLTERGTPQGASYFGLFEARVEKRFSHGFQLLANFLESKLLERRSFLNPQDAMPEKRISSDDRPWRFVFSANWDLPFGKGRAIGAGAGPLLNRIIGGWTFNVIQTMQPGPPLSWGNVLYLGGDLHSDPRNIYQAFDVTRFNRNSSQQLASNLRTFPSQFTTLRSDGVNNLDLSMIKNVALTEKIRLQLRGEFFNSLNHPEFNPANLSPTSSAFATISSQANLARSTQVALRLIW